MGDLSGYASLSHRLSTLNFGASQVQDSLEVAAFLSILFPSARLAPRINENDSYRTCFGTWGAGFYRDMVLRKRMDEWTRVKETLNLLQRRATGPLTEQVRRRF